MLSEERNRIVNDDKEFAKVTDFSVFGEFDCADDDLNDFIWNDAAEHKAELIAETYLFKFVDIEFLPIAFVSLLNDSIKLTTNKERRIVPNRIRNYPEYPAVKIGRLGVHREFQGSGVGTAVLDMIKALFTTNNRTGCRFLTVEAYDLERVLTFYKKNEFLPFPGHEESNGEETRLMFFDLARHVA